MAFVWSAALEEVQPARTAFSGTTTVSVDTNATTNAARPIVSMNDYSYPIIVSSVSAAPDEVDFTARPELSLPTKVPEKFLIMKSLTAEDLEASGRNGICATLSHNESALNQTFDAAEQVCLVLSANKSGGYFGDARMCSRISDEV